MKWSEPLIAGALVRQVFNRRLVLAVPRCNWTGYECDLLGIEPGLRIIDIEIKISRADVRADRNKDKWWRDGDRILDVGNRWVRERIPREWPPKVWKHYFVMPAAIWTPELGLQLPSPNCGVVLLGERHGKITTEVQRRAIPNRAAKPISATDALDIARLAGLRMWDTFDKLEKAQTRGKAA